MARLPARTALIDGEVAVPLPDGRTSFQALQNALGRKGAGTVYYVFDLLHLDGRDLRGEPLEARKQALATLLAGAPAGTAVHFSDHVVGQRRPLLRAGASPRAGGHRLQEAARPLPHRAQPGLAEDQVHQPAGVRDRRLHRAGGLARGAGRAADRLLRRSGKLVFAGKVGTGFTQAVLRDLRRKLGQLQQRPARSPSAPPAAFIGRTAHWTRPELVAEIAFIEWTDDGRLRHPSFQGLREDKPAREVVRETGAGHGAVALTEAEEMPDSDDAETSEAAQSPRPRANARARVEPAPVPPATAPRSHGRRRPPPRRRPRRGKRPSSARQALKKGEVEVLGQRLSNPDRVYYPEPA